MSKCMISEAEYLGKKAVTIENEFLKITVIPELSQVVELCSKRTGSNHLLTLSTIEEGRVGWGAYDEEPEWVTRRGCSYSVSEAPEEAIVTLRSSDGKLEYIKELRVRRGVPKILVSTTLRNVSESTIWARNRASYRFVIGGGGVHGYAHTSHFGQRVFVHTRGVPIRGGALIEQQNEKFTVGWGNYQEYVWEDCDWIAVLDTIKKEGVALRFLTPTPTVRVVYEYHPIYISASSPQVPLSPGAELNYSYEVVIFDGLSRVDHVDEDFIAAVTLNPMLLPGDAQEIELRVLGLKDKSVKGAITVRPLRPWEDGFEWGIKEEFSVDLHLMKISESKFKTDAFVMRPEIYVLGPYLVDIRLGNTCNIMRMFVFTPEPSGILERIDQNVRNAERLYAEGKVSAELLGAMLALREMIKEVIREPLERDLLTSGTHKRRRAMYEILNRSEEIIRNFVSKEAHAWKLIVSEDKRSALRKQPVKAWIERLIAEAERALDEEVKIGYPRLRWVGIRSPFEYANKAQGLGLCYFYTGDKRYGEKAVEILMKFADNYSKYKNCLGETLHLAVISIPLIMAYDFVHDLLSPEQHAKLLKMFFWLLDLLEDYVDVTGINWDVVEAAGLLWLAVRFNYVPNANRKVRRALNVLEAQLSFIREDGGWTEESPGYHMLTLRNFIYAAEALRKLGIDLYAVKSPTGKSIKDMLDWVLAMCTPYLTLPALEDSGRGPPDPNMFVIAANRYKEPKYLWLVHELSSKGLMPREPLALLNYPFDLAPEHPSLPLSQVLAGTGRVILRSGHEEDSHYFILDYGPHGGGHGHPDKLSFELHAFKMPLVIDAGSALYESTLHRTWNKHTRAHNTVMVDEEVQRFTKGELRLFQHMAQTDFVQAVANTYPDVTHTRSVIYRRGEYFIIHDLLEARSGHKYSWLLHLSPLLAKVRQLDTGYVFSDEDGRSIMVMLAKDSDEGEVELLEGPKITPYVYGRYKKVPPSKYIRWDKVRGPGKVSYVVLLVPFKGSEPQISFKGHPINGGMVISLNFKGKMHIGLINYGEKTLKFNDIRSDAMMALLVKGEYIAASNVSNVAIKGLSIEFSNKIPGFELSLRDRVIRVYSPAQVKITITCEGKRLSYTSEPGLNEFSIAD